MDCSFLFIIPINSLASFATMHNTFEQNVLVTVVSAIAHGVFHGYREVTKHQQINLMEDDEHEKLTGYHYFA